MDTTTISQRQIIFFPHAASVQPKNLIAFDDTYLNHLFKVKHYLNNNIGRAATILFRRINSDGSVTQKRITGIVKSLADDRFIFSVYEDMHSKYDFKDGMHEWTVRFDNVLGDIPLMADAGEMNIVRISPSFSSYRKSLVEMRTLLLTAVGKEHAATLYFRYPSQKKLFFKGDYHVDCEILEVNKSTALIRQLRSNAYINKNNLYLDLGKYEKHVRFVSDCYLWKVDLCVGQKHEINCFDD